MISIVAAKSRDNVIGRDGKLPWNIPEELKFFHMQTVGGIVIMGRKTFESVGKRPLPERINLVVSRGLQEVGGVHVCEDLESAIKRAKLMGDRIYIIGGGEIYKEAIGLQEVERMSISIIKGNCVVHPRDILFPVIDSKEWAVFLRNPNFGEEFDHLVYQRRH